METTPETTLTAQLIEHVRGRIAGRAWPPGTRLPSIRALARTRQVSKSTVVLAYERLVADGTILPRPGAGFYVAARPQALHLSEVNPRADRAIDPVWIARQSLSAPPGTLLPGCGWLPDAWMPVEAIRRALRGAARVSAPLPLTYGSALGYYPLRAQIARRLTRNGPEVSAEQILLTDSGTQSIDLICRLLLNPGDTVLVDDPCYFNFLNLLGVQRVRVIGVPMTTAGPDLAVMEQILREHRPRLYLTTAALHNPTGVCPPPQVVHRLLKLIETHSLAVIEDDVFGDFEPAPVSLRLAACDGLRQVLSAGSFSKTLSASVRTGFIAARPDWIEALVDLKLATTVSNSDHAARLVHGLLVDGSYRRHVEALQEKLARARAETARHLRQSGLTLWTEPRGGCFLWAALPDGLDSAVIAREALRKGVMLAPGNVFSASQTAGRYLRFNASQCQDRTIFQELANVIDKNNDR